MGFFKVSLLWLFLCSINLNAQETFKIMFYNLLDFPSEEPLSRIQDLNYVLGAYQPDLLMVCELNDFGGGEAILEGIHQTYNPHMAMATFFSNTSDDTIGDQNDLQNIIFYNTNTFTLLSQDIIPTLFRDFNRYTLRLNTLDQISNPIILDVFVCHLKASDGIENENLRKEMVDDLIAYLNDPSNDFDHNSHVILAGDFNVYSSSEPAFQELINPTNTISFIDPANRIGNWHNNVSFVDVFTQSTRTVTFLGGSSGGLDDRFDFIMTSENMQSDATLSFVPDSYNVFGNNNNPDCYNSEVNSSDCSGVEYDQALRDALYYFSDHLPVTLQLQTNQTLSAEISAMESPISFPRGNMVSSSLYLNVNNSLINNDVIIIYNNLGQKLKSIQIQSRNYIESNMIIFKPGVYYITLENHPMKPIKFIKSN